MAKRRNYLAIAEYAPGTSTEEARWWISFPSFPGVTSAAYDAAELMQQAQDALASAAMVMCEQGQTLPPAVEDGALPIYDLAEFRNPLVLLVTLNELLAEP